MRSHSGSSIKLKNDPVGHYCPTQARDFPRIFPIDGYVGEVSDETLCPDISFPCFTASSAKYISLILSSPAFMVNWINGSFLPRNRASSLTNVNAFTCEHDCLRNYIFPSEEYKCAWIYNFAFKIFILYY